MGFPQILWLVIQALGLGLALKEHGSYKTGKNNFWISLSSVIVTALILWWGGFFG